MSSRWNTYLERLLANDLTREEHTLALALMRLLLGWNTWEGPIGDRLLRDTARMHGRSLERARTGLITKGLIFTTPGRAGRGNRTHYTLLLQEDEMPAATRAITPEETTAQMRALSPTRNHRGSHTETPAPERARKGRKGKDTKATIVEDAIRAYLNSGGHLEQENARSALTQQARTLLARGTEPRLIIDAASQLGRQQVFPGYLQQQVASLAAAGGACSWDGVNRAALTPAQLAECDCTLCQQWLEHNSRQPSLDTVSDTATVTP